jgi:hypothetical protein
MLLVWLPLIIIFGIGTHLSKYLQYKSVLRKAKKHYKETGEKRPVRLVGYGGLPALGIIVVSNIVGFAATGAAGMYFLLDDEDNSDYSGY